ncbi:MAG TPA: glycerophosphodiester phosphodiesterase [Oligoflexus sp.]|uniref:glycerophosphodiester phosphodiesterase n=1 Tax=Oligoflexus sp. TaxID=1971216 RepID=UPI002D48E3B1|nr:glycerophosphodiester phosphodiesterase [Oligoflexus sp.]HYX32563.1 glycerophosphodiester phosphodiesterase [Oligoflexus sp.]
MKVIAHRGACTEALENSWDAFRKAVEAQAFRIELDVHLTRDGQLAVVHDESLERTAGVKKLIADMTRSEVERTVKLTNGEPLPFLDDVLTELLPQIEFNVEVKSPGHATVEALAALIHKQSQAQRIIVSAFMEPTVSAFSREYPELRNAYLWDKSLWWPLAFQLGPKSFMTKNAVRIFHPDAALVTPSMVRQIKLEGWEIYPYISLRRETNREQLWSYLMTVGVDGLCTNYPREMQLWLQEALDDSNRFSSNSQLAQIKP